MFESWKTPQSYFWSADTAGLFYRKYRNIERNGGTQGLLATDFILINSSFAIRR